MASNDHYDRACTLLEFQILQKLLSDKTLKSIFQDAQEKKHIKVLADLEGFVSGTAPTNVKPGLLSKKEIDSIVAYTKAANGGASPLLAILNFGFNDDPMEADGVMKYLVSKGVKNLERVEDLESLDDVLNGALPGHKSILKAVLAPFIKDSQQQFGGFGSRDPVNTFPAARIPPNELGIVPQDILDKLQSESARALLSYIWKLAEPELTPKGDFTEYRTALERDPSFYKVDFPTAVNPTFVHKDGVRKIDFCMMESNPLLEGSDITNTANDILEILDRNSSLGQQHVTTVIAPTASGKTTAAFIVGSQTWTIYMEVPDPLRGNKSVYGDGMKGLTSDRDMSEVYYLNRDRKDKEAYVKNAILRNIYARALALLCLFSKGLVTDTSSWLHGQIDGYSKYIQSVYKRLEPVVITRVELNELLDALKERVLPPRRVAGKEIRSQLVCIVDEAQVLMSQAFGEYSVPDHPDKKWTFLQLMFTEFLNFNISQVFMGTEFRMAHNTALATALLKSLSKDRIKIFVVTRFLYLTQKETTRRLSQLLNLKNVDERVVKKITWSLTGRPRPLPSFVVYFADLRRAKVGGSKKEDPTVELEECFENYCKNEWLPELRQMLEKLRTSAYGLDVCGSLAKLLKADLVRGFGGAHPTTDSIPLLEWGVCPMKGHNGTLELDITQHEGVNPRAGGHECLKNSRNEVFTYEAQPLEPMLLLALQQYLGPTAILSHMVKTFGDASTAQGRGIEFNAVVMAAFMQFAAKKMTLGAVLTKLAPDQKFQYPKWVPLSAKFAVGHMVQARNDDVLAPFLYYLATKTNGQFRVEHTDSYDRAEYMPGVAWEEVGIICEETAGSDGVLCVKKSPEDKPVVITFGCAVYKKGVPRDKCEHQQMRSNLRKQYLRELDPERADVDVAVETLPISKREFGEYHCPKDKDRIHEYTCRRRIINRSLEELGGQIIFLFEIPNRQGQRPRVLERIGEDLIVTVDDRNLAAFVGQDNADFILRFTKDACASDSSDTYQVAVDPGSADSGSESKKRKGSKGGSTKRTKRGKKEYRVEEIIERKIGKDGREGYIVKWENYPPSANSWVSAEDMYCPALLAKFNAEQTTNMGKGKQQRK